MITTYDVHEAAHDQLPSVGKPHSGHLPRGEQPHSPEVLELGAEALAQQLAS